MKYVVVGTGSGTLRQVMSYAAAVSHSILIAPAVAIVLFLGVSAEAQNPKQGTYTGKFGWWAVGNLHEVDKNHMFWMGQFSGTFFNDAGSGFMDHISLLCPGVNDLVNGESKSAHGYCTGTDKDGDKLYYVWQGEKFAGTFQFTGGTGKYTGLKGNNSWRGYLTEGTSNGYSEFTGEWQLP